MTSAASCSGTTPCAATGATRRGPPSRPRDHVDERGAPVLHHAERAAQGRTHGAGGVDGALGVDAEALGEPREVRRGIVDADADDLVLHGPPARLRDDLLVLLVVAVRAV